MTTKKYCFQLGLFPEISLAEIASRLPNSAVLSHPCPEIALVEVPEKVTPPHIRTLGGTLRIAEYIEEIDRDDVSGFLANILEQVEEGQKIHFATTQIPASQKLNKKIILETKKILTKKKRSIRFINRNFQNPDVSTVHRERLLGSSGRSEFLVISKGTRVILAKTLSAYNPEEFSIRDYEKPERDTKTGMLPPKLALMMTNLSAENGHLPQKIWDPFCGTGTILGESLLLTIPCSGSDISPELLKMSRKNLSALEDKFSPLPSFHLFRHDASAPVPQQVQKEGRIAVVTEGYLGPTFHLPPSEKDIARAQKEVDPLMSAFFRSTAESKGIEKMVVCLPFWKTKEGKLAFPEKALAVAEKFWKNGLALSEKSSEKLLLYRRQNQHVGRCILVLKKR
ncbi:hypothetical protein IPN35_03400 [Candidatus Peregrinibacteria bacterium]|nr:MAG: hypothetical protein IPN35_03400 [Candidatus Peregrinibacteria bacterium]